MANLDGSCDSNDSRRNDCDDRNDGGISDGGRDREWNNYTRRYEVAPEPITMMDRLSAYLSWNGAADFSAGASISYLMIAGGGGGNYFGFPGLVGAIAGGIAWAVINAEGRIADDKLDKEVKMRAKRMKKAVKKTLKPSIKGELKRQIKNPKQTTKPKAGGSVNRLFHQGVNESRLCPFSVSEKLCDKLKIKDKRVRRQVWLMISKEMHRICRNWNTTSHIPRKPKARMKVYRMLWIDKK